MTKRSVIFLFYFLVFALVFAFADNVNSSAKTEDTQIIEQSADSFDESSVVISENEESPSTEGSSSTFSLLLRMIVFLAIVILAIWLVFRFMKKNMAVPENDDIFMRIVSSVNISPTKSVKIVTLTDKYAFMVGVSEDSVSLISQIDDIELIQAMNLYSDKQKKTNKPKTFADILDIFMPGGPRDNSGALSGTKQKITDLLEKQRSKFNGEK